MCAADGHPQCQAIVELNAVLANAQHPVGFPNTEPQVGVKWLKLL